MTKNSFDTSFQSLLVEIGAPLFAIACVTSTHGVPVGALSSVWAAVLTAAVIQLVSFFAIKPLFSSMKLEQSSPASYFLRGALNVFIGVGFAIATLPSSNLF